MEQIQKRVLNALPFAIALFDEGDDGGDGGNDGGNASGQGNDNGNAGGQRVRNDRGQFTGTGGNGNSDRVYATDLAEANRRIGELNEESAARRRENRELKNQLSTVQSRQSLVDQRAIRMEAREALRANGVIDPDVVDLFLKHAGDTIKIDAQTGDVVGVDGALSKFKEAKAVFFKTETGQSNGDQGNGAGDGAGSGNGAGSGSGSDTSANGGGQSNNDTRGNATGTGSSVAGGGTSGDGGFKVANFRDPNVNADEAMERYMRTLR